MVRNEVPYVELGEQLLEAFGIPEAEVGGVARDHNRRFNFFCYVDGECSQHDRLAFSSENLHQLRLELVWIPGEEKQSCHLDWVWFYVY